MADNSDSGNTGRSGPSFLAQIIFQIVLFRVIYSLMTNSKDVRDPYTGQPPMKYKNYFSHNEVFDIYACYTDTESPPLEVLLENNVEIVYSKENQIYTHKFNQPFDVTTLNCKPPIDFYTDKHKQLYFSVYLIPHKAYVTKKKPFYKSELKEGFLGHYITKNVPLTLNRKIKKDVGVNLMDEAEDEYISDEEFKHWIPRLDLHVVYDTTVHTILHENEYFHSFTKYDDELVYDPYLFLTQFWILEEQYVPIKPEQQAEGLSLKLQYSSCSPVYFMVSSNFRHMDDDPFNFGINTKKEFEMVKKTLMTTNIYMLIFSGCFILLHSIFSFFAFKNDVQFWRSNESMEGISAMTIVTNFICEIIIGLYIYDSEKTSWLILFEIFLGIIASGWKVTKAVNIKINFTYPFVHIRSAKNYVESNTKEYDKIAIKYMSIAMAPCVVGYAIYSLYYNKHKSWYSYFISVAAGSVYTFGFIMMTPQLYINYKLKSVDHLPWRALIYKSLNTFVDDVASFLIEMPTLHRLSCFRDDVIFFCYLYQRWKYKVDPTRKNEWTESGQSGSSSITNISEGDTTNNTLTRRN